jgi:hypothetical protein
VHLPSRTVPVLHSTCSAADHGPELPVNVRCMCMHTDGSTDFYSHWLSIAQDLPAPNLPLQRCELQTKLNRILAALWLLTRHHQIPFSRCCVCISASYNLQPVLKMLLPSGSGRRGDCVLSGNPSWQNFGCGNWPSWQDLCSTAVDKMGLHFHFLQCRRAACACDSAIVPPPFSTAPCAASASEAAGGSRLCDNHRG